VNSNALIGFSGFVGKTLAKQAEFSFLYRSSNIHEIKEKTFDKVFCAGASAKKWLANRDPESDLNNINKLVDCLQTIKCRNFILISTVDVFKTPWKVDEETPVDEDGLHAYGRHRRLLEKFVQAQFDQHLIVRLPGLVGPGLQKNIIFDLLNNNNISAIESRNIFQFYPMVNLWDDIQTALQAHLRLVHLTSVPISVADVAMHGFGMQFSQQLGNPLLSYDMRTRHAKIFGVEGSYQYSMREVVQAIRSYAQSEPVSLHHWPQVTA